MRDQYAGDVSDFLKIAFLRALTDTDRTLGVAWYYNQQKDEGPDGRHLEWREEPAWCQLDPQLHKGLSTLPERSVAALEDAAIWPKGTVFHREPITDKKLRNSWAVKKRTALNDANIVFLDPDNGIGGETNKHATFSEIRLLRKHVRAIVFITFPGRSMKHDALLQQLHERLVVEADVENIVTLRTNVSVPIPDKRRVVQRARWFTVVDPDNTLIDRTNAFSEAIKIVPRVSVSVIRNN